MATLCQESLVNLEALHVQAARAEVVTWQGRQALRLEDGLALIADSQTEDGSIELFVGVEGPAYPGIAFRVADVRNFELAYATPHASGQWDALQYDPVFHGSNTWQIYHSPSYQRAAQVPIGSWFRFKVAFCANRAAISVDDQPPLVVERLARPVAEGMFGLWTYRPAYFCDLHASGCDELDIPRGTIPGAANDVVEAWFVEGYGVADCEANGPINVNRYLPLSMGSVRLTRQFEMLSTSEIAFQFGFSDALSLELDGEVIFEGERLFKGFADRRARGYAEVGEHSLQQVVRAGLHRLTAVLRVSEPFGWGLILAATGTGLHWLPVGLG
jgi:hypothetical protein